MLIIIKPNNPVLFHKSISTTSDIFKILKLFLLLISYWMSLPNYPHIFRDLFDSKNL